MFYTPSDGHGLPHDPIKALIAPRPIAWVGTRGASGDNLAAYSFFTMVSMSPPMIAFSVSADLRDDHRQKDTLTNVRETEAFSISIASAKFATAVAASGTSSPMGVDEFTLAGVGKSECRNINVPFVAGVPAVMECQLETITELRGGATLVIGEIIGVHIDDQFMNNGQFNSGAAKLLYRMGYFDYGHTDDTETHRTPPYTG